MKTQHNSISGISHTPSDFRVIAIISTYNEEDIIVPVIDHLVNDGVGVYLIDNWSTDHTFDLVNQIGHGIIGIERWPKNGPSQTYDWAEILKRKEILSQELDADWFINQDADEVRESPWKSIKLRDAIYLVDQRGYNAIDFTLLNFFPVDNGYEPGSPLTQYFKYFLFNALPANDIQIKAWKKTSERVIFWESGGHSVEFSGRKVFPYKFIIRHYPIRSQAHGEKKIFIERQVRYNPLEREKGWHIQYDSIQQGESFLKERKNLIKFESGFYNEFLLRQMMGREQVIQTLTDQMKEQEQVIQPLTDQMKEQEQVIQTLTDQMKEQEQVIQTLTDRILRNTQSIKNITTQVEKQEKENRELTTLHAQSQEEILFYADSKSWKMTRPLRKLSKFLGRNKSV